MRTSERRRAAPLEVVAARHRLIALLNANDKYVVKTENNTTFQCDAFL